MDVTIIRISFNIGSISNQCDTKLSCNRVIILKSLSIFKFLLTVINEQSNRLISYISPSGWIFPGEWQEFFEILGKYKLIIHES